MPQGVTSSQRITAEGIHFQEVFEATPDAIVIADDQGQIIEMNAHTEQLFEYPRSELLGNPLETLMPGRFHHNHRVYRQQYSAQPRVRPMGAEQKDYYGRRQDGREFPVDISLSPLHTAQGLCVIAAIRDITRLKRMEQTLGEREVLHSAILRSLDSHIAVLDRQGSIIAVNDAWLRFGAENAGASEANIGIGVNYLNVCDLATGQESENAREMFVGIQAVLEGTRPYFEIEYPCHSPTEQRWFLMSVTPLVGSAGGVVVAHKNVTELKQAQLALQDALGEIQHLKDQLEQENISLQAEIKGEHNFEEIIGQSKPLRQALRHVEQVAPTTATVLILGETGTGKELFARAIHSRSARKARPLVKVNCAALPANLIESELFGHERGAFTGAIQKQVGRFEVADGGTIFLDEIGELPIELQPKLLRVLQEGEFERVGTPKTISVDVRVIAATNRDLEDAVRNGRFREDLYYRLSVYPIPIPALRERKEDLPLLVPALIKKCSKKIGKTIDTLPQAALDALQEYAWPGNVRELENVIERAVINAHDHTLRVDLPKTSIIEADESTTLENLERDYILRVLTKTRWRIAGTDGAAAILGMNPSTLRSRLQKLGITKPWA